MKSLQYLQMIGALFLSLTLYAQQETSGKDKPDTLSLLQAFQQGKTEGHLRMFFMSTDNKTPLTDYYALAFGGGLKYEIARFKGFQAGIGGFYIWNLASSDLTRPDNLTHTMNRYEMGQFDQTNAANKKNLQRLENFYIKYNFKNSFIRYGKQVIKTPFINPQDGRMRPTGEQGFWGELNEWEKIKLELGWLTHISPRGTVKWYSGANSLGIYPTGVAISGEKSDYTNNLDSKGIAIVGINYKPNKSIKLQAWNYWIENVFNTLLLQADADYPIEKEKKFIAGVQYIHQRAIHNGGNADAAKTYFDPIQKANIYGLRAGYKTGSSIIRINYTRITKNGRFLFPREWGREPFFTFLSRERNEGLGDVHAFTFNLINTFLKEKLTTEISSGYYKVADVRNARLNKYGLPSYYQANLNMKYAFDGSMKGLTAELLYLYKKGSGKTYNDWKYTINKVDMHQLNLVLNYYF